MFMIIDVLKIESLNFINQMTFFTDNEDDIYEKLPSKFLEYNLKYHYTELEVQRDENTEKTIYPDSVMQYSIDTDGEYSYILERYVYNIDILDLNDKFIKMPNFYYY